MFFQWFPLIFYWKILKILIFNFFYQFSIFDQFFRSFQKYLKVETEPTKLEISENIDQSIFLINVWGFFDILHIRLNMDAQKLFIPDLRWTRNLARRAPQKKSVRRVLRTIIWLIFIKFLSAVLKSNFLNIFKFLHFRGQM